MPVKLKPADTWFSKCVREASGWTCARCGSRHEPGSMGLHNSHVFSRSHRTIRWAKDNTQALCFSCHQWYGGNPADSGAWVESFFGEAHMEILRDKKNSRQKVSKAEEKEIAAHYRKEYEKLMERRKQGESGQLDFESWQ